MLAGGYQFYEFVCYIICVSIIRGSIPWECYPAFPVNLGSTGYLELEHGKISYISITSGTVKGGLKYHFLKVIKVVSYMKRSYAENERIS